MYSPGLWATDTDVRGIVKVSAQDKSTGKANQSTNTTERDKSGKGQEMQRLATCPQRLNKSRCASNPNDIPPCRGAYAVGRREGHPVPQCLRDADVNTISACKNDLAEADKDQRSVTNRLGGGRLLGAVGPETADAE